MSIKSDIKPLTHDILRGLINELSLSDNRVKLFEIFEDNGERYIRSVYYSANRQKPFVFDQSAKVRAVASLKRFLSKDLLGQVEHYHSEYDALNNNFTEYSVYTDENSNQSEKIEIIKQKLKDLQVFAEQLHIEEVEVEHLAIHDGKVKRQAKFNETIDYLIKTLSCEHS